MSFREVTTVNDRPCFSYQCVQFFFTVCFVVPGHSRETSPGSTQDMFLGLEKRGKYTFWGPDSGISNLLQPQSLGLIFLYIGLLH